MSQTMREALQVLDFLSGVGELEGCGFGDKPAGERGNYWWRRHLPKIREALSAPSSEQAQGADASAPAVLEAALRGVKLPLTLEQQRELCALLLSAPATREEVESETVTDAELAPLNARLLARMEELRASRPAAAAPAVGVTDWPAEAKDIADAIDSFVRAAVVPDWDNLKSWRNHLRRLIQEDAALAGAAPAVGVTIPSGAAVAQWCGGEFTKPRGDTGQPEQWLTVRVERLDAAIAALAGAAQGAEPVATKNAARYEHLRNGGTPFVRGDWSGYLGDYVRLSGDKLDAAIDAAMAASPQPTGTEKKA